MEIFRAIKNEFETKTGLRRIDCEYRNRPDGDVMIINIANPSEKMYSTLQDILSSYSDEFGNFPLVTINKKTKKNLLTSSEGKLLLRTLSESLNINRHSFEDDFFSRYTRSVFGAEEQIEAAANHVVYGRRGAGKSSLLLYALHTREVNGLNSVWIDMQTYSGRSDLKVIVDVFTEILDQVSDFFGSPRQLDEILNVFHDLKRPDSIDNQKIAEVLPDLKRLFAANTSKEENVVVFLDDIHVLDEDLQPVLLGDLYSVFRGNNVYLKISAIETLTNTWDPVNRQGLEIPHDLQQITLDYNLTIPDKATSHISSILDAHARFCGLPSIRNLCTSNDVLSRLVWVTAGVPRDASNLFAQAMTKVTLEGRRHVSVSSVNVAASEAISLKLRDLSNDASGFRDELTGMLETIKEFVLKESRRNAFLLEISSNNWFEMVRKLVDLRILHVISEGISIGEAGRKHIGLILDYGFYTGIRAARSVDLFNQQTTRVTYRDLRKLPVLTFSKLAGN